MLEHKADNARRQAKYRAAHPERTKNRKRNLEAERARTATRRARKMSSPVVEKFSSDDVLALYGSDCHICHEPVDLSAPRRPPATGWQRGLNVEHVVSLAMGGEHTIANCRPAHALCNLRKGIR